MVDNHRDCRKCTVSKIVAMAWPGTAAVGEGIQKDVSEGLRRLERLRIKFADKGMYPPLM